MKLSVVMTTYNASNYIREQLQSLYEQEKQPDEVIILDDKSTDDTIDIVEEFIEKNNLSNWSFYKNSRNVGWKQNFINGFKCATGDLIFPCDQDDVWHKDKIKIMSEIMEKHTEIEVLVGMADYLFMESSENSLLKKGRYKILQMIDKKNEKKRVSNTKQLKKQKFDKRFKIIEQGCRMCVRREFWKKIEGYWFSELAHDRLFSFYSKLNGGYYILDYAVMDYRFHVGSASNPGRASRERRLQELKIDLLEIENLKQHFSETQAGEKERKVLEQAEQWNKKRMKFVGEREIWSGIQLMRYLPYYPKLRRYLSDWIYAISGK